MSERRLYIDPSDEYQTEVLAPAVRAREPFGKETDVIELDPNSYPSSTRAREDNVDGYDTPVYVFREGDEVTERFEGGEIETDRETYVTLADEHGFVDHERGVVVASREGAVSE